MEFISLHTSVDEKSRRKRNFKQNANEYNYQRTTVTTERMRIPYFRSVFMRTTLPTGGVYRNESGIVNLDSTEEPDIH